MTDGPGPLVLVGGNEFTPGNEPQDRAFAAACGERPAYVVVTAAVRHDPAAAARHAADWFAALALPMTELAMRNRTQATAPATVEAARTMGGAYLCGGDPGIVVTTLRGTAGWEALVGAWRSGAALAGSSAGAMALGEWTLLKGRMPGDHERRYADALNLVPGVAVIPHWDEFGATWVPSASAARPRSDVVLLGLDTCTAAAWDGTAWHALGRGNVTVIAPDGERATFRDGARVDGLPPPR
jgi:cyanophycinase